MYIFLISCPFLLVLSLPHYVILHIIFPVCFHVSNSSSPLQPICGPLDCLPCPLLHWSSQDCALSDLFLYLTQLSHVWLTHYADDGGIKHIWKNGYFVPHYTSQPNISEDFFPLDVFKLPLLLSIIIFPFLAYCHTKEHVAFILLFWPCAEY